MSDITILGCGLVGPALALQLAGRGFSVDLFDRGALDASSDYHSGRSINMTLCTRGMRALEAIGLSRELHAFAVPVYGRVIHQKDGFTTFCPYGQEGEALYSIRRDHLRALLLERLAGHPGVSLFPHHKCIDVDLANRSFEIVDGDRNRRRFTYQRLLGADGTNSVVRKALEAAGVLRSQVHVHDIGYRELRFSAATVDQLRFRREAIHIWPRGRNMLLALPNVDGSTTLSLFLPIAGGEDSFERLRSPEQLLAFFREEFADVQHCLARQIDEILAAPVGKLVTVRCSAWSHAGEVVLVGDAAHAILPFYGQGVNAGFEDCKIIAGVLTREAPGSSDEFRRFETRRKADMDLITDLCYKHMELLKSGLAKPQTMLRHEVEQHLYARGSRLRSLYYNIAFTDLPYTEGYRQSLPFERFVDQLLKTLPSVPGRPPLNWDRAIYRTLTVSAPTADEQDDGYACVRPFATADAVNEPTITATAAAS